MKSLFEITKEELFEVIERLKYSCNKKNRAYGFIMEDEYCDKPVIRWTTKNENVMFKYDYMVPFTKRDGKLMDFGCFYWIDSEEPYFINEEELVEKIWKIIERDYQ